MVRRPLLLLAASAVALASALIAPACDGSGAPPTTSSGPPRPDATATTEADRVIAIEFAGGGAVGGSPRVEIAVGDTVTIRVTSDVAEVVHVHGYDLIREVGAGGTVEITFLADIPGVFEVEMEQAGAPLVQLQVGG